MTPNHNQIFIVAGFLIIVIMGLGEWMLYNKISALSGGPSNIAQNSAPAPGSKTGTIFGVVRGVEGTTIKMFDPGSNIDVSVSAGQARVISAETPKSSNQLSADFDAYNAKLKELLADPEKNRAEIERLQNPSLSVDNEIALTDLHVGDSVTVTHEGKAADGSYVALSIVKVPPPQQPNAR